MLINTFSIVLQSDFFQFSSIVTTWISTCLAVLLICSSYFLVLFTNIVLIIYFCNTGLPPDIIAVYITQYFQPTDDGFTRFELNLRVNLHDTVHCRVGGDMCRMTSANAPEFFLHHAFIDKIWANWQEYSHQHMIAHFSNLSFVMTGTRWYRPRDFINTHDLPDIQITQNIDGRRICVSYEDPTRWEYNEIMRRLKGNRRLQITLFNVSESRNCFTAGALAAPQTLNLSFLLKILVL